MLHLTNVYGPCEGHRRLEFFRELRQLGEIIIRPWSVVGDFNVLRDPSDNNRATSYSRPMQETHVLIDTLGWLDLPFPKNHFTWSNMQLNLTLSCLNNFFVNSSWDDLFPLSSTSSLPRLTFDHSPLVLNTDPISWGKMPFSI